MDWMLLAALSALMFVGVCFVFSASYRGEDAPAAAFFRKQVAWAFLGLACLLGFALFDYRKLRDAAPALYVLGIALLILVLTAGKKVYGAYRWLNVFGFQVQPSEFAKLATVLLVARVLSRPALNAEGWQAIAWPLAIVLAPFVLILKEPDLGTAMVLLPTAFAMMFAAGASAKKLGLLLLAGVLLSPLGWFGLGDYQKERILVFLDPGRDPLGAGWNKIQSEIAVGSGGLWGKGYLKGTQNVLGFLPRTVAPTDFIFSVIAEETGFVGSAVLLSLYSAAFLLGFRAAARAPDKFGRLLAVGITTMLACHVLVNIAMTVGLVPITGLPLPLISYGGSFMVSTMIGWGLIQSVFARRIQH
jgi:rod shape determining protein RodA